MILKFILDLLKGYLGVIPILNPIVLEVKKCLGKTHVSHWLKNNVRI